MEGKLIKVDDVYRLVEETKHGNSIIGTTDLDYQKSWSDRCQKLSLKNCQAIENGYDLDELAEKHYDVHIKRGHTKEDSLQRKIDFILGFQKAIEILGDKKFSEEDMIAASKYGYNFRATTSFPEQEFEDSCIRNTQQWLRYYSTLPKQTEWEVEILMETCSMNPYDLDCSEIVERPKLDADGCLILKRK